MKTVRMSWVTSALAAFAMPVLAQGTKPADPAKPAEPAKPTAEVKPAPAPTAAAEIGKPAPDFTLKDVDGKDVKLASFKGKIVVLEWASTKCPVCQDHYKKKTMQNTLAQFKDKGVIWLAVDSSNWVDKEKDSIAKWWKDQGAPFPYLLDASGQVGKSFGAKTTPHMFVIDAKGTLVYSGAIDDNADGSKPKPQNYVADAVNALLKGSAVATATTKSYGCSVKYAN